MLPTLLLLSATVVSTPVIISEVKATRESGHLRVEVRGDGGIDPETARTRIDEGSLYLFLGGTRVKADNRAWNLDLGVGEIRAHRHRTETELDVPLAGNGCSGPVQLQGTPTGMIALVGCEGAAPMPTARRAAGAVVVASTTKVAPRTETSAVETKLAPKATIEAKEIAKATAPSLNALVALPANDEAPVVKAAAVLPVAAAADEEPKASASHKKQTEAAKDDKALAPASETKAEEKPAASPGLTTAKDVGFGAGSATSGGLGIGKLAVPVLLLSAVAIAAYLLTRRKRGGMNRQIEILESASLGPKRSLIVARVGEETLYLGSSEAGITLLKSSGPPQAASSSSGEVARVPVVNELDQSLTDALADVPEPSVLTPSGTPASFRSIEGGLATLFGRGAVSVPPRPEPRSEPRFDEILEDSFEDQELRRKLAAGMSARVR
jgi:flagellar protein FliO/FliZ